MPTTSLFLCPKFNISPSPWCAKHPMKFNFSTIFFSNSGTFYKFGFWKYVTSTFYVKLRKNTNKLFFSYINSF